MKLPITTKFKFNRTWVVLGIAIVIGALAALGARNYLSSEMAAIEARGKGEQVNVVVAKGKMQKGEVVSAATVAVRGIPSEYAHSSALMPDQFDTFDGKVLANGVKAGEVILWSMLEGKKAPSFSARVEEGRRAITVPVDEINSISGLLEPGDLIDLMLTVSQKDKKVTFPVLQTVRVMATGQRSVDDPKNGERRQYSTVTLDTTPEQAQTVIMAREAGKVTALLRNPNDQQQFRGGNKSLLGLNGLGPDGPAAHEDQGLSVRQVPVLYGGQAAKLPAEGLQMGKYVRSSSGQLPAAPPGVLVEPSRGGTPIQAAPPQAVPAPSPSPAMASAARQP
jgi:pilus assembly protein CpaB